ncbi:MAG: shikimate kinase [Planctomycetes bacterium]|nr:shikimate kinase [Planctomycetota bacterium]
MLRLDRAVRCSGHARAFTQPGRGATVPLVLPRLTLVGYRASGKTTLGRLAAARVGWPFADSDKLIETQAGRPIAEIFASEGEAGFRDRETAALAKALDSDRALLLATGGGAILRPENRALIKERGGLVVYLRVAPDILAARLRANVNGRPSLTGKDPADEVTEVLAVREPLYEEIANATLSADSGLADCLVRLMALVENHWRKRAELAKPNKSAG